MHRLDWLTTNRHASCPRTVRLGNGAVNGGQTLEVGLQPRAERGIESVARTPERVAARLGASDQLERGRARRLELV